MENKKEFLGRVDNQSDAISKTDYLKDPEREAADEEVLKNQILERLREIKKTTSDIEKISGNEETPFSIKEKIASIAGAVSERLEKKFNNYFDDKSLTDLILFAIKNKSLAGTSSFILEASMVYAVSKTLGAIKALIKKDSGSIENLREWNGSIEQLSEEQSLG